VGAQVFGTRVVCTESGPVNPPICLEVGDCVDYCPEKWDVNLTGAVNKRITAEDENCTLGSDRDCGFGACYDTQQNVYCGLYCDYTSGCV
jgi:hypothetical protein